MKKHILSSLLFFAAVLTPCLQACTFLWGTTEDETVQEIFEQGSIDPQLVPNQVGYVPILPFWNVSEPIDVYAGYDQMVYIVTPAGLEVRDLKGTLHRLIAIPDATDVVQDRRLHTYVCGRVTRIIDGTPYRLAAVFHIIGAAGSGEPVFADTLIHPFCDVSRNNTAFRGADDEAVSFTGLATLHDNTLYVSRSGPTNNLASAARPDNTILLFDAEGKNIGYTNGLSPTVSSLKSCLNVGALAGFAAPPQQVFGISTSPDFLLVQQAEAAQYKALWIVQAVDPDAGITWKQNDALLQFDLSRADRFLYTPNRFTLPADIYVAPDAAGYIFLVDAARDSLYQFTRKGYEGVNPPPNSTQTKQILASFGGTGSGPYQFCQPSGVCYLNKTVYVADRGNNRICRYKLSTDLQ
ncbi:MAG: hypothetical protein RMK52_06580 [Chitinophagales bacterium]|nr:hypothetical protein [Chitinophagales bacterium]MDW8393893.1 hypothetical protein [Chitinophagales bacterium]